MPFEVKSSFLCLFWNLGWGAQAALFRSVRSQVQAYVACLWLQDIATAVRGSDLVDSWILLGKKLGRKKQAGIVLPAMQRGWIQVTFKHSTRTRRVSTAAGLAWEARWIMNSITGQLGGSYSPLNWQLDNLKLASVESFCTAGLQQRHTQVFVVTQGWGRDTNPPWQLQWDWGYSPSPHGGRNLH